MFHVLFLSFFPLEKSLICISLGHWGINRGGQQGASGQGNYETIRFYAAFADIEGDNLMLGLYVATL